MDRRGAGAGRTAALGQCARRDTASADQERLPCAPGDSRPTVDDRSIGRRTDIWACSALPRFGTLKTSRVRVCAVGVAVHGCDIKRAGWLGPAFPLSPVLSCVESPVPPGDVHAATPVVPRLPTPSQRNVARLGSPPRNPLFIARSWRPAEVAGQYPRSPRAFLTRRSRGSLVLTYE